MTRALSVRKTLLASGGQPFDPTWFPITADGAGNHHCVVTTGKHRGKIVDYDHEAGGGGIVAISFARYVDSAEWG